VTEAIWFGKRLPRSRQLAGLAMTKNLSAAAALSYEHKANWLSQALRTYSN